MPIHPKSSRHKVGVLTFQEAVELLGNRPSRKLANNTYLHKIDSLTFGVMLHNTYVVRIHQHGIYGLDSGGYHTVTTKDRINRFSPAHVYQKDGMWYLDGDSRDVMCTFWDRMLVNSKGNPVKQMSAETCSRLMKTMREVEHAEQE